MINPPTEDSFKLYPALALLQKHPDMIVYVDYKGVPHAVRDITQIKGKNYYSYQNGKVSYFGRSDWGYWDYYPKASQRYTEIFNHSTVPETTTTTRHWSGSSAVYEWGQPTDVSDVDSTDATDTDSVSDEDTSSDSDINYVDYQELMFDEPSSGIGDPPDETEYYGVNFIR